MSDDTVPRRILLKLSGEALMGDGDFGIDPDRFDCDLLSSMEADRFVELVTAMHKKIQRIGPCSGPDF
jgi:coenzyme F420-reducing hydrogenase delta subunit